MNRKISILIICCAVLLLIGADIGSPPNTFSTGQTATAAAVNQNFTMIYNEFNGNIDNENLASDLASLFKVSGGLMTASGSYVGIGTTSPGSALDILGTLRLSGSSSGYVGLVPAVNAGSTVYTLPSADGTSGQVLTTNGSGTLSWPTTSGGASLWTQGGGGIYFNGGYVGIGTISPDTLFDVQGPAQFGTGNVNLIDASGKIAGISATYFASLDGSSLVSLNAGSISNGSLHIGTMPTGGAWTLTSNLGIDMDTLYVDQVNSRIGIGTVSPEVKLDIIASQADGEAAVIFIRNEDIPVVDELTQSASITGILNAGSTGLWKNSGKIVFGKDEDFCTDTRSSGNIQFHVNKDNIMTEMMRITKNGYVGIGTSSPTQLLEVNGTIRISGFQLGTSSTSGYVLTADSNGIGTWQPAGGGSSLWTSGTGCIYYDEGNIGIGISTPTSPLHIQGNYSWGTGIELDATHTTGGNDWLIQSSGGTATQGQGRFVIRKQTPALDAFIIDSSGNVGIGKINPNACLHVRRDDSSFISIFENQTGNGVLVIGGGTSGEAFSIEASGGNRIFRVYSTANVCIGIEHQFGSGEGILSLSNAVVNPSSSVAAAALLYVSGGELFSYDASENTTQLSPHDPETGEWIFYSKNTRTGRVVRVNMEKLVREVELLSGKSFLEEWTEE